MVTLLVHMHSFRPDYPTIPMMEQLRKIWDDGYNFFIHIKGSIERAEL